MKLGKMDFVILAFGAVAIIITLYSLIQSNNYIGILIVIGVACFVAYLFAKNKDEDLVEMERLSIIQSAKNNKHKLKELFCVSNDEIKLINSSYGKIVGFTLYGTPKQICLIVESGLWILKKELIYLIPKEYLYNPSKKQLEGNVYVKSAGFIQSGIFLVPNTITDTYLKQNEVSFSKRIDYRGITEIQKTFMKLQKQASGLDSNFLKAYSIKKQQEFNPED